MGQLFIEEKCVTDNKEIALDIKRWSRLSRELEEYLNKPISVISKEYWELRENLNNKIEDDIYETSDSKKVLNYYKTTDKYLYELLYWESTKNKEAEFKKLYFFFKKFKINKVLDYGGGIGGLSIFLFNKGINCDYLDMRGKTFDFAKWRFKKRGMNIIVMDALENKYQENKYQGIVAYDVLEHILDLEIALQQINKLLINGGLFLHKSTFSGGDTSKKT